MQEIIKSLKQFVSEFHIPMDWDDRMSKCLEEDEELAQVENDKEAAEESADRVITGILNLLSLNLDPEQAVKDKIELTFEKYRRQRSE
jgi:hypothetical protein